MSTVTLVDYEELFKTSTGRIIQTGRELMKKTRVSELMKEIFFDSDNMSFAARCPCGHLVGDFFEGAICPNPECGEPVKSVMSGNMDFTLWLEIPEFAAPMLHPRIQSIMCKYLGKYGGRYVLDILMGMEPEHGLPDDIAAWYIPGWNEFYNRYDEIITYILDQSSIVNTPAKQRDLLSIKQFLNKYRHLSFTRHVPVLDTTLHLITRMGDIRGVDQSCNSIMEMIVDLSCMQFQYDNNPKNANTSDFLNKRMASIYQSYLNYNQSILDTKLIGVKAKKGYIRHNGMGIRTHWSFRGVISPIVEPHEGDELHMPWKAMVRCLALECINVLVNRKGLSPGEARQKVDRAEVTYDKEIHDIIDTLIMECPYKGLPVAFDRNPSLILGSCQLFFITKVLPTSDSILLSPTVIKAPNADFDGDQMNGWLIKEMGAVPHFMNMHPSMTMFDKQRPGISNMVRVTDQAEIVVQAWLDS